MLPVKMKVSPRASIPEYKTVGSSGADISACLKSSVTLQHGEIALIPTGISIELPHGYEAQIRPRSGLAMRYGVTLLNTPGTVDSDYRGEIKIILANFGKNPFVVENGMRIAQIVFCKVYRGDFIQTDEIDVTDRNNGGFGHTGI